MTGTDEPLAASAAPHDQGPAPALPSALTPAPAPALAPTQPPLRRRAWLMRWALQAGVPLLVGSLTLVATAWQIGSELELTREAEQRSLAINGNVQMLRASSDYLTASSALSDHLARNGYVDWAGTADELSAALAADDRYLDLQHAVFSSHDEVVNSFNELLVYGDPQSIAAARTLLAQMPEFDASALPVSDSYALAQDRFVYQMCTQLSPSPEQCAVKALH